MRQLKAVDERGTVADHFGAAVEEGIAARELIFSEELQRFKSQAEVAHSYRCYMLLCCTVWVRLIRIDASVG